MPDVGSVSGIPKLVQWQWIFCGEQPEFQSGTPHNRYYSPQAPKLAKNTKFWNGLKNNYLNIWYS